MEIKIKDKNGVRNARVELTGQETAEGLLSILGLDPVEYEVRDENRVLALGEAVPLRETMVIERRGEGVQPPVAWRTPQPQQDKIALTLAMHSARGGSETVGVEVKPNTTPFQLADTLVKRHGGMNAEDIKQMADSRGRNLMEQQHKYRTFSDLGVRTGEVLDIQGDITQG